MENHPFQWVNPLFQLSFSIAMSMLNYQRVTGFDQEHWGFHGVSWDVMVAMGEHRTVAGELSS